MTYEDSAIDSVREKDLDLWVSGAFVMQLSLRNFVKIRDMIEDHLEDFDGEKIIHGTASGTKLFIVKEKDYKKIQTRNY
jgi:hypothetical protein